MRNNGNLKELILFNLKHGKDNAIKKVDLARRCNANERTLRLSIRDLIDEGHPVCGSPHPPHGYYLADSQEEIKTELTLLRSYGKELFRRYSTLRKIKASFVLQHPGQLSLKL